MKTVILFALSLISINSFAFSPSYCWKESGYSVQDGGFIVLIDGKQLTGQELVTTIATLQSENGAIQVTETDFNKFTGMATVSLLADQGNPNYSRAEIQATVNPLIQSFQTLPGVVSIDCNPLARHYPAATGSNKN